MHTRHPSTEEVKAGESGVQGHNQLYSEFEAGLEYIINNSSQKYSEAREERKRRRRWGEERREAGEIKERKLKTFPCPHCPIQCSASGKEASGKARSKVELAGSPLTA